MALRREIKLFSPVGADAAVFSWPLTSFDGRDGFEELRETFKFVWMDIPELRLPCENILNKVDSSNYDSVKDSCERFNKAVHAVQHMWKGTSCSKKYLERHRPSTSLLKHILSQCYYRAVTDPAALNNYPPFSPEVYGETSFELVERMVHKIRWQEGGIFIDLGSGVGQVVLQVAASVPHLRMAYGVERAEVPSGYAKAMDAQFRFWMNWYGKSFAEYQIVREDFLTTRWAEIIAEADVVFANNFAFGPQVNHELKQRLQHMKEGAKIVCSLSLCPLKFEITERNLSDIGAILRVEELSITPNTQAVSWTGRDFSFYLHTVDRTMLEKYFERKVKRERVGNGSTQSSSSSVTNEDSMASGKSAGSNKSGGAGGDIVEREAPSLSAYPSCSSPFGASDSKASGQQQPNGHQNGISSSSASVTGAKIAAIDSVAAPSTTATTAEKSLTIKTKKLNESKQPNPETPNPAVPTSNTATVANGVVVHRGRGRPAKVPKLSGVPVPAPKKSSSSSHKPVATKTVEESDKQKRKRASLAEKDTDDVMSPPPAKGAKATVRMPAGLDILYRQVITTTTSNDPSTSEGRLDAYLMNLRNQMKTYIDHYKNATACKPELQAKLEAAKAKRVTLQEKCDALQKELDQISASNKTRFRQHVDSLSTLANKSPGGSDAASSTSTSKVSPVVTVSDLDAVSKRIVKRNKSLRDLMNNASASSSTASLHQSPQQVPTASVPSSASLSMAPPSAVFATSTPTTASAPSQSSSAVPSIHIPASSAAITTATSTPSSTPVPTFSSASTATSLAYSYPLAPFAISNFASPMYSSLSMHRPPLLNNNNGTSSNNNNNNNNPPEASPSQQQQQQQLIQQQQNQRFADAMLQHTQSQPPSQAQQQQAAALFNSTLQALIPYYGSNPSAISPSLLMSFMPPDILRQMPNMTNAPPSSVASTMSWYPGVQQPNIQQQQPQLGHSTLPSGQQPLGVPSAAGSVEDKLKAIMANVVADKKRRQTGVSTPGLESSNHVAGSSGTATPDNLQPKKTPQQRRTPNKPRKQQTPTESSGGNNVQASPSRSSLAADSATPSLPPSCSSSAANNNNVTTSTTPGPAPPSLGQAAPVPLTSTDMFEFLSHLPRQDLLHHPQTTTTTITNNNVAAASLPSGSADFAQAYQNSQMLHPTSTPTVHTNTTFSSPTVATTSAASSSSSKHAPVFHISSMVFRPTAMASVPATQPQLPPPVVVKTSTSIAESSIGEQHSTFASLLKREASNNNNNNSNNNPFPDTERLEPEKQSQSQPPHLQVPPSLA